MPQIGPVLRHAITIKVGGYVLWKKFFEYGRDAALLGRQVVSSVLFWILLGGVNPPNSQFPTSLTPEIQRFTQQEQETQKGRSLLLAVALFLVAIEEEEIHHISSRILLWLSYSCIFLRPAYFLLIIFFPSLHYRSFAKAHMKVRAYASQVLGNRSD